MKPSRPLPPEDSIDVEVRVIARASRDEVGVERAGRLVVRTPANPVDNQANEAVCRSLAHHFGVPRRHVELLAGHRSRDKTVRVHRVARTWRLDKLPASAHRPG
jgi:uncharacterized protein YggU (UPF0235/DUF167 family)